MTGFDLAIIGVVALSALIAYFRGIVRSLIGLVAWVAGIVAGIAFAPTVAKWLPEFPNYPVLPYALAFVIIFLVAIVVGALLAWPLHAVIHKAGLGFLDRGLGVFFGIARGMVVVLAFVLAAGFSPLPDRDWWQNSLLAPPFESVAMSMKPWLPATWGDRLHYPDRSGASAPGKA